MSPLELPTVLQGIRIDAWRPVAPRAWIGEGPDAVVLATELGRLEARAAHASDRLARRVRDFARALGTAGHAGILRPLSSGVLRDGFAGSPVGWLAAESPGPGAVAWRATHVALETLASALAFLHDRRLAHGGVTAPALWLRADGTTALAPWRVRGRRADPDAGGDGRSRVFQGLVFSAPHDVRAFARLLPVGDPEYDEIARACSSRDADRPANGRSLFVKLRSTSHGQARALARGIEAWDLQGERRRLAADGLERPPFTAPDRWQGLLALLVDGASRVRLVGAPGSGKTRWLAELADWALPNGFVAAAGRSECAEGPLVEALVDLASRGYPVSHALEAARSAATAAQLARAFADAAARIGRDRPVLLLVDDVDRLDSRTAEAVGSLRARADSRHLVLVTTETCLEGSSPAPDEPVLRIPPFEECQVRHLLRSALGGAVEHDVPLARLLLGETEGAAFHTIELLRELVSHDVLVLHAHHWSVDWDALGLQRPGREPRERAPCLGERTFALPRGVEGMLGRRFAGLAPAAHRLLRALACAQGETDIELLAAALETDADELLDVAEPLARARIVHVEPHDPCPVRFRDRPTRKYFVEALGTDAARMHRGLLRAYEARWGAPRADTVTDPFRHAPTSPGARDLRYRSLVLLAHAAGAGDEERRRQYLVLAATAQRSLGNFSEARDLYGQALRLPGLAAETRDWLRLAQAEVHRVLGDDHAAYRGFRSVATSRRGAPSAIRSHAFIGMLLVLHGCDRSAPAIRYGERALALSDIASTHAASVARRVLAQARARLGRAPSRTDGRSLPRQTSPLRRDGRKSRALAGPDAPGLRPGARSAQRQRSQP